jgi:uncharacterized protein (DUF433 family)
MTIKWVKSDPLVMNGEPFCFGTRLTVRNLLEMRGNGVTPMQMLSEHPELKPVGIAEAFVYAADHGDRYAPFIEADGSIRGPGFQATDAEAFPEHLRRRGVVVGGVAAE